MPWRSQAIWLTHTSISIITCDCAINAWRKCFSNNFKLRRCSSMVYVFFSCSVKTVCSFALYLTRAVQYAHSQQSLQYSREDIFHILRTSVCDWGATLWLIALCVIEVQIATQPIFPGSQMTAPMNIIHPQITTFSTLSTLKLELLTSDFRGCWRVGHLVKLVCLWGSLQESTRLKSAFEALDDKSPLSRFCTMHHAVLFRKEVALVKW